MHEILLVGNIQSYINISIKNMLKESGYLVEETTLIGISEMKIRNELRAILLFLDETTAENLQVLYAVNDRAIEKGSPVFLIGTTNEIRKARTVFSDELIAKVFARPIDVNEIAHDVDEYIKEESTGGKKKILVVDDSGAVLRNVKAWLEDRYQVALANSGAMAIKYLALNRPDLVLLDYEMPVCDGKQVLEMMRMDPEFSDIPVIFLTSKSDKESVMNVMELRLEGYLLKTMPPNDIIAVVDDFFRKQKK